MEDIQVATLLASHTLQLCLWSILIAKNIITYDEVLASSDQFLLSLEGQQNAPGVDSSIVEMARQLIVDSVEKFGKV